MEAGIERKPEGKVFEIAIKENEKEREMGHVHVNILIKGDKNSTLLGRC